MTDVRIDPGIAMFDLAVTLVASYVAVWTGGAFWLALAIWLWFSAIVAKGFFPYLSDEQIIEIRRKEFDERIERRKDERDKDRDLREGPPEDQG